ncbi:MAG: chromate efflux transporter, partial [Verrucomicrobiae bacterium]|nr:chromate efflux transporter [Verrucomicrobiae bacterium]
MVPRRSARATRRARFETSKPGRFVSLSAPHPARPVRRLAEVARGFLKLGLISFGGPVAHIGYLRAEFVHKRRWLDDAAYGDLVALSQFLPGPASSQVVFGLGMQRAGWLGGLLASLCFTLPSAALMIGFGYGVTALGDLSSTGWLHGLKLAAVAVVAQAVWGMGRRLCPDRTRLTIALAAAALLLCLPGAWVQVGVIVGGGTAGWWWFRKTLPDAGPSAPSDGRQHLIALGMLAGFLVLLLLLPILASTTGSQAIALFDSFYRAGALVFGGGHVILPLLRAEVVPSGWVSDNTFLAGYGAAQALPGPLFTFAGHLGTTIRAGSGAHAWLGGLWGLLAIFLPAWLLIGGALPFWQRLRAKPWTQAALRGANAAVVGVLLAALYDPVWTGAVADARDVATALVAFGLLQWWKAPPWLVVALAAA